MVLEIQKFLRENADTDWVSDLEAIGVFASNHSEFPNIWHFRYDTLIARPSHPIVRECRGLILDEQNDWKVVAFPFVKFANAGEAWADEIDWSTAKVYDKMDGSLMVLSYYEDAWRVSTTGSITASGSVNDFNFTFAELFWKLWERLGYDLSRLDKNLTYMLEMVTPYNRVICRYPVPELYLLGARDIRTYDEQDIFTLRTGIRPVKAHDFSSLDAIKTFLETVDPMETEGFVVVDAGFRRLKVKCAKYVQLHYEKDGFGLKDIVALVQRGESSELVAYFPEYMELHRIAMERIDNVERELTPIYEAAKHHTCRKTFAAAVLNTHRLTCVLFTLRDGKVNSIREGILKLSTKSLIRALNLDQIGLSIIEAI